MSSSKTFPDLANGHGRAPEDPRVIPPMGMTAEAFQERAIAAVKEISRYYQTVHDRPVLPSVEPGYLPKLLPACPPEQGEPWSAINADIESKIMPGITHWQSPKYMAFFPASSTYPAIIGEMWSAALTSANFNWICSPAVTELENVVMDWLVQILHLPSCYISRGGGGGGGGGVIQGSASEALVTTMVAARERYVREHLSGRTFATDEAREDAECELRSKMVALASTETHSSARKAAIICGVRFRAVPAPASSEYALRGAAVRSVLDGLTADGLHPFHLTMTLGTTNTCSVDRFDELADLLRSPTTTKTYHPHLWLHVDGAYAGAALVLPEEARQHAAHFAAFDSVTVNLHKWLLVNFDASLLYVRDRRALTDALTVTPTYLRNRYSDQKGLVTDYRDWQIPLGRRFRALKVWFTLRTWGAEGLRQHVRHGVRLGHVFADLVRSRPDLFALLCEPRFGLTVLTVNAAREGGRTEKKKKEKPVVVTTNGEGSRGKEDEDEEGRLRAQNEVTRQVITIVDEAKEFFLTPSVIGGVQAIRVVSANPLAEEKYVRMCFDVLVDAAERVLAGREKQEQEQRQKQQEQQQEEEESLTSSK